VPVLIIHGMMDGYVLYRGGVSPNTGIPGRFNVSVDDAVRFWSAADGCADRPVPSPTAGGRVIVEKFTHCRERAEVRLMALTQGPHEWPLSIAQPNGVDEPTDMVIWHFFEQHRR
jgi:poly(3-hydroxybutyrate) depolymerase